MIPNDGGRYCNSCAKTVIDFTLMEDKEVQDFFLAQNNQPVCGRFKNNQLHRIVIDLPSNILQVKMPVWMRFMVACLVILGLSIFPFETTIAGKAHTGTSIYQGEPIQVKKGKKPGKQKKKKRKKKKKLPDFELFEGMVLGNVWGPSELPINISNPLLSITDGTNAYPLKNNVRGKTPGPFEEPPVPIPFIPSKFILPAILVRRKRKD